MAHSKDCSFPVTDLKVKAPFFWFVEAYSQVVQDCPEGYIYVLDIEFVYRESMLTPKQAWGNSRSMSALGIHELFLWTEPTSTQNI